MTDLPSTELNAGAGPDASEARLAARGATIAYERHVVSRDLDVDIPAGVFTAIVGPNACGKSTLLRAMARLHQPARGAVLLDGADIARLGTKEVARRVGLLPQSAVVPGGMLVRDLVARGRFPHQGMFRQWSREDRTAVEEAMENVREAIGFHIEGLLEDGAFNGIQASRIDDLKMQEGYADAIWGLVDLDVGRYSVRQTRFNVSWPEYLLARVDAYASAHHETRSGFLAKAAERMLSASASGGDSPSA